MQSKTLCLVWILTLQTYALQAGSEDTTESETSESVSFMDKRSVKVQLGGKRGTEWADSPPGRVVKVAVPPGAMEDALLKRVSRFAELRELTYDRRVIPGRVSVTDNGVRLLSSLGKLETIDLSWTEVTDKGLEGLPEMKSLKRVYLNGDHITDQGLVHLARCESLESLSLDQTRVTAAGLAHLQRLRQLRRLSIAYNLAVTNEAIGVLRKFPMLESLNVRGTAIDSNELMMKRSWIKVRTLSFDGLSGRFARSIAPKQHFGGSVFDPSGLPVEIHHSGPLLGR